MHVVPTGSGVRPDWIGCGFETDRNAEVDGSILSGGSTFCMTDQRRESGTCVSDLGKGGRPHVVVRPAPGCGAPFTSQDSCGVEARAGKVQFGRMKWQV